MVKYLNLLYSVTYNKICSNLIKKYDIVCVTGLCFQRNINGAPIVLYNN